ncbi:MAG: hypothetical protein Q9193_004132 [Seirophora villosa]
MQRHKNWLSCIRAVTEGRFRESREDPELEAQLEESEAAIQLARTSNRGTPKQEEALQAEPARGKAPGGESGGGDKATWADLGGNTRRHDEIYDSQMEARTLCENQTKARKTKKKFDMSKTKAERSTKQDKQAVSVRGDPQLKTPTKQTADAANASHCRKMTQTRFSAFSSGRSVKDLVKYYLNKTPAVSSREDPEPKTPTKRTGSATSVPMGRNTRQTRILALSTRRPAKDPVPDYREEAAAVHENPETRTPIKQAGGTGNEFEGRKTRRIRFPASRRSGADHSPECRKDRTRAIPAESISSHHGSPGLTGPAHTDQVPEEFVTSFVDSRVVCPVHADEVPGPTPTSFVDSRVVCPVHAGEVQEPTPTSFVDSRVVCPAHADEDPIFMVLSS